jgi:hypothetical protein
VLNWQPICAAGEPFKPDNDDDGMHKRVKNVANSQDGTKRKKLKNSRRFRNSPATGLWNYWTRRYVSYFYEVGKAWNRGQRTCASNRGVHIMTEERTWWETIKIESDQLVNKVKELIQEGNVRRIVIKHGDHTVAEFPLTIGVVAAVFAPILAAVAAIAALVKDCKIEVERVEKK